MIPYIVGLAVIGLGSSLIFEQKSSSRKTRQDQDDKGGVIPLLAASAELHEREQDGR
jgi:hypothetical protein